MENKSKRFLWFYVVMLLLSGLLFCVHIYAYLQTVITELYMRGYLYAGVYDFELLGITILISLVIPMGLFLGCIFAHKAKKRGVKTGLSILCVTVLFIHLVPCFFLNALGSGIASYTEDMDNYGVFDESVNTMIERCQLRDLFPEKDLLLKSSQYSYYYTYGAMNENYHIQVDAQFSDADTYDRQIEKMTDMGMVAFSDNTYYQSFHTNGEKANSLCDGRGLSVVAHFDEHDQRITYYIFVGIGDTLESVLAWIQAHGSSVPIPVLP